MTIEIKSQLWTYATGFYAQEAIQQKCLELQDVYGASVDVILWLCWLDSNRIHLPPATLNEALTIVGGINQELLGGLPAVRRDERVDDDVHAGHEVRRVPVADALRHARYPHLIVQRRHPRHGAVHLQYADGSRVVQDLAVKVGECHPVIVDDRDASDPRASQVE